MWGVTSETDPQPAHFAPGHPLLQLRGVASSSQGVPRGLGWWSHLVSWPPTSQAWLCPRSLPPRSPSASLRGCGTWAPPGGSQRLLSPGCGHGFSVSDTRLSQHGRHESPSPQTGPWGLLGVLDRFAHYAKSHGSFAGWRGPGAPRGGRALSLSPLPGLDLLPLCVTFLLCFWEVQYGILAGTLVSGLILLHSVARPRIEVPAPGLPERSAGLGPRAEAGRAAGPSVRARGVPVARGTAERLLG